MPGTAETLEKELKVTYSLSCADTVRPEAEYAVRVCLSSLGYFFEETGAGAPGALLCYGSIDKELSRRIEEGEWAVAIEHDEAAFLRVLEQAEPTSSEARLTENPRVPVLNVVEGLKQGKALLTMKERDGRSTALASETQVGRGGLFTIHFDLPAAVFFFLSRIEETRWERDVFGRFPQELTLCAREGFEAEPAVNAYLLVLKRLIENAALRSGRSLLRKLEWPGGEPYCVSLTHDVDRVAKWRGRSIAKGLLVGKAGEVWRSLLNLSSDPWWNFERIRRIEEGLGFRSSFYFFGTRGGERGGRYNCLGLKELIQGLSRGGWEIGLHGSYGSMLARGLLEAERKALEKAVGTAVTGVRQHYLRLQPDKTVPNMEGIGFQYDASVGFSDRVGFRSSFCLPYRMFDLSARRMLKIIEIPISIMDGGLPKDDAGRKAKMLEILESVRRAGGVLSPLWHQRSFTRRDFPGLTDLYEWIVNEVSGEKPYFATHGTVCAWWQKREGLAIGESASDSAVAVKAGERIERLGLELLNARGLDRIKGAALEHLSEAGEGRIRIILSGITSPGFELVLREKSGG